MGSPEKRRVAVVTDSTAYIPPNLVQALGITVVPLTLIMGDQTWLDGVEIDPPDFYRLLKTSSSFPTTSQPNAGTFYQVFSELAREHEGIVAVLISNRLSGTVESAQSAAAQMAEFPIEVIDSRATAMMLGLPVLEAAREAANGEDLAAVATSARECLARTSVFFVVETLEYLHRGGRIGGAAKLLGSALNLKPILEIRDGLIVPVTKVRTRRKAIEKLYSLMQERLSADGRVHIGLMNIDAPDEAARMRRGLEELFHPVELIDTECSPVIGAHAGPGTVAVAFFAE